MLARVLPAEASFFAEDRRQVISLVSPSSHRGLSRRPFSAVLGKSSRFFTCVPTLAEERPPRAVIGHVFFHGHARNGAADHVASS